MVLRRRCVARQNEVYGALGRYSCLCMKLGMLYPASGVTRSEQKSYRWTIDAEDARVRGMYTESLQHNEENLKNVPSPLSLLFSSPLLPF